jgi:hypothetical protein
MGEMADYYSDYSDNIYDEWETSAYDYLHMSDTELRADTAKSRDPKIMSIRKWENDLSEKQRWCLANWIAQNDINNGFGY